MPSLYKNEAIFVQVKFILHFTINSLSLFSALVLSFLH